MTAPLFLEVDQQDEQMIRARFPDAVIHSGILEGDELVAHSLGHETVCCFIYSRFTEAVLKKLPRLKLLCTRSVGVNHIDVDTCRERGITVCNVPDYGSHVIAEHVFALLLSSLRHITEAGENVKKGNFDYHGLRGMTLMGKTIGIAGTGRIGRSVAKIAHGFGMRILATDLCRSPELERDYGVRYLDLDDLLPKCDILSLHLPALPETTHCIDQRALGLMKDGAIIVNTARGELIDSAALLSSLQKGKVRLALLDVLEHEKDFIWNQELINHPHVVVTPHIAFYADDSMHRMYIDAFQSIDEWQRGGSITHLYHPIALVCDLPGVRHRS